MGQGSARSFGDHAYVRGITYLVEVQLPNKLTGFSGNSLSFRLSLKNWFVIQCRSQQHNMRLSMKKYLYTELARFEPHTMLSSAIYHGAEKTLSHQDKKKPITGRNCQKLT